MLNRQTPQVGSNIDKMSHDHDNNDGGPARNVLNLSMAMTALLRDNTDVMADVLGFLTRRELALQLASVNIAFSALSLA